MKPLYVLLFLCFGGHIAIGQIPESNLIFRLDYENDLEIDTGETAYFEYQGGFLSTDRFDAINNACTFEADKQIIKFEDFLCLEQELTISLWVKYENFQEDWYPILLLANQDEFNPGETKHLGFEFENDKTSLEYYNESGGKKIYDQDSLSYDNEWHHLVGTYDELSIMKFYIDNTFVGFQEFDPEVYIGLNQIIIGGGFNGLFGFLSIDDIRIYNRSLERCEIDELFYENVMTVACDKIEQEMCDPILSTTKDQADLVRIFPNPLGTGVLNVEGVDSNQYTLFNILGEKIAKGSIVANEIHLPLLSKGLYLVQLDNSIIKLVIE